MTQSRAVGESTTPERADTGDYGVRLEADLTIAERVHRSMIPANQRRGNLEIVWVKIRYLPEFIGLMARLSPPYDTLSRAERGSPRAGGRKERPTMPPLAG